MWGPLKEYPEISAGTECTDLGTYVCSWNGICYISVLWAASSHQFFSRSNLKCWFSPLKLLMAWGLVIWGTASSQLHHSQFPAEKVHCRSCLLKSYIWQDARHGPSLAWCLPYGTSFLWGQAVFIPVNFSQVPRDLAVPLGSVAPGNGEWLRWSRCC